MKQEQRPGDKHAMERLIAVVGIAMGLYQLTYTQYILQASFQHQITHLGFALSLVFLGAIRKATKYRPFPVLFLLFSLATIAYLRVFMDDLMFRVGSPIPTDILASLLIVLAVVVATKIVFGWAIPIVATIFLAYAFLGQYIPGPLGHPYIDIGQWATATVTGFNVGMFGSIMHVSANYIFLFMLFGGLFQVSGAPLFFMEVTKLAGKRLRSGPAQAAVLSSGLMGMVSGVAVSNVAITGQFTIPLMKKVGYSPEQSAAVEAVASTGGQIMPPVLGAAAFLMVAVMGVPYKEVIKASAIPAILYFGFIAISLQLSALKKKMPLYTEKVDFRALWTGAPIFAIPLALMMVYLVRGMSPMYAVFRATVALIILTLLLRKRTGTSFAQMLEGFAVGAIGGAGVAVTAATLGVVLAVATKTGLALTLAAVIENVSGGHLLIALAICGAVSYILGMGLPTMGAYLIVAIVAAPALVRMGVELFAAHFFALYFSLFSLVTPPVAMAAVVASGIAKSNYIRTGWEAMKLALPLYLVGFMIIKNPLILARPSTDYFADAMALVATCSGILALTIALIGHSFFKRVSIPERILFLADGILLVAFTFTYNWILMIVGSSFFIVLILYSVIKKDNSEQCEPCLHTLNINPELQAEG